MLMTILLRFIARGYRIRKKFRSFKEQGIPMMEHSIIFGHLKVIWKLLSSLPADAHDDYLMRKIQENWKQLFPQCTKCPPIVYLDTWPFLNPLAISLSAELSFQFTQEHSKPKFPGLKHYLYPLSKSLDIVSMEGDEWRIWRKRLNPGFSIQYITSRIPEILEEVEEFRNILKSRAGKDYTWGSVFLLESATRNLLLDMSARFFLNTRLHEQWGNPSSLKIALEDVISKMVAPADIRNALLYYNPWRHFRVWRDYRTLTQYHTAKIQRYLSELEVNGTVPGKALIDLVVQGLVEERDQEQGPSKQPRQTCPGLTRDSLEMAVGQINMFLFAGLETTASSISWLFRLLCQHPAVLARLRQEHDAVLGPDPWGAADALREKPQLVNMLPYTHAAIRESMRVHTNISSIRYGEPGFFLTGPPGSGPGLEGKKLPAEGFVLWDGAFAIHHDPEVWHRADEFLPERFLVTDTEDPLYPPPNAWRSFSAGPRNCIGQHLALVEIKLVMAIVVRCFDVECAWDEWDRSRRVSHLT
ncbi:hypothetical protein ACHAPT_005734 [Fusarium lateritium]